jgi:hypothetical protein
MPIKREQEQAVKVAAILCAFERTRAKLGDVNPVASYWRREIEAAHNEAALDALAAKIRADGTLA